MPDHPIQIFLSYTWQDEEFARRLAELIEERGVSVFDPRHIAPGESISNIIRQELEKASAVVMLLPASDVSGRNWIWFEAGAAKALGKRVLAVLPPSRKLHADELPSELADLIILDADTRPLDRVADTLVSATKESKNEAAAVAD